MFERITINAERMGGQPCIRDLRIPVATIVAMVEDGLTEAEILRLYPDLELEDIHAALRYHEMNKGESENY
jgi:uncharacterized protein (DUF433 family)